MAKNLSELISLNELFTAISPLARNHDEWQPWFLYGIEFFLGNLLFCSSSNETAEPIHLTMSIRNSRKDWGVGSLCFISPICQDEIDLFVQNFNMHFNKLFNKKINNPLWNSLKIVATIICFVLRLKNPF